MIGVSDELLDAIQNGHADVAADLLGKGASPHADAWGLSLLDEALARQDERIARVLLAHGARLDEPDEEGRNRLHRAASARDDADAVGLLLRLGLDPNGPDGDGWTPLHYAAAYGHGNVVRELLGAGADRAARTTEGKRAADLAATNGHAALAL